LQLHSSLVDFNMHGSGFAAIAAVESSEFPRQASATHASTFLPFMHAINHRAQNQTAANWRHT
jgi:hypothetical protein